MRRSLINRSCGILTIAVLMFSTLARAAESIEFTDLEDISTVENVEATIKKLVELGPQQVAVFLPRIKDTDEKLKVGSIRTTYTREGDTIKQVRTSKVYDVETDDYISANIEAVYSIKSPFLLEQYKVRRASTKPNAVKPEAAQSVTIVRKGNDYDIKTVTLGAPTVNETKIVKNSPPTIMDEISKELLLQDPELAEGRIYKVKRRGPESLDREQIDLLSVKKVVTTPGKTRALTVNHFEDSTGGFSGTSYLILEDGQIIGAEDGDGIPRSYTKEKLEIDLASFKIENPETAMSARNMKLPDAKNAMIVKAIKSGKAVFQIVGGGEHLAASIDQKIVGGNLIVQKGISEDLIHVAPTNEDRFANYDKDIPDDLMKFVNEKVASAKTDREKLLILYDIVHDLVSFKATDLDLSIPEMLVAGKGDCVETSRLFAAFAHRLGIPVRIAEGFSWMHGLEGGHAWPEAYFEGKWQTLNMTAEDLFASDMLVIRTGLQAPNNDTRKVREYANVHLEAIDPETYLPEDSKSLHK